jgi:hypothetical protein
VPIVSMVSDAAMAAQGRAGSSVISGSAVDRIVDPPLAAESSRTSRELRIAKGLMAGHAEVCRRMTLSMQEGCAIAAPGAELSARHIAA